MLKSVRKALLLASGAKFDVIHRRVLLHIAWRNITTKKLRSALTLTGVVVGIGSIFFLLSFGIGLQDLVTKQIVGNQSVKTIDVTSTNSRIIKLDQENVDRIRQLPHVDSVGVLYSFPGILSVNGSSFDAITYGPNSTYQTQMDLTPVYGRLLNKSDNKSIVVNTSASKALGFGDTGKKSIGKTIKLAVPLKNSEAKQKEIIAEFKVVGVVSTGAGSEVYVPSFLFDNAGVPLYSQVRVNVDKSENISPLRKQIETKGFQTTSPGDTIDQVNQMFTVFNLVMIGFGSIGMLIAVLGMFNTLTISLLERTKEIGLMISLGGRNNDMSKLFVIESMVLSVIGAVIGIILAVAGGQLINVVMMAMANGRGVKGYFQLFAYPWWLIVGMILFMCLVGLVVAYFPAKRAQKINPIDALRRE